MCGNSWYLAILGPPNTATLKRVFKKSAGLEESTIYFNWLSLKTIDKKKLPNDDIAFSSNSVCSELNRIRCTNAFGIFTLRFVYSLERVLPGQRRRRFAESDFIPDYRGNRVGIYLVGVTMWSRSMSTQYKSRNKIKIFEVFN